MTIFGAIGIASTGMTVHRKWLDAISDNITNANNVSATDQEAFHARYVVARELTGGGVQVAGIVSSDGEGTVVSDPSHPLADGDGYVRHADVDMASQMTQLIMAQRGYQASAAVVDRAKATYESALQIGRN
ncbi:flagellar basal body rod C-terminal domain-containing protein [Actinomycetaceae bacterium L2_0104]